MTTKSKKDVQRDPEAFYYRAAENRTPSVLVLGALGEQWTDLVAEFFESHGVSIAVFDWGRIKNVRITFELTRYPVIQLWCEGTLNAEVVGYCVSDLTSLLEQYHSLNRGNNGKRKKRI